MGSKTRLSSYCTKRANNGVNLVTSRKINTRLARPITPACDRPALWAIHLRRSRSDNHSKSAINITNKIKCYRQVARLGTPSGGVGLSFEISIGELTDKFRSIASLIVQKDFQRYAFTRRCLTIHLLFSDKTYLFSDITKSYH